MYVWDQAPATADDHAERRSAARNGHSSHNGHSTHNGQVHRAAGAVTTAGGDTPASRHAQAVQVSLDRRDNGGAAGR
jgi:hypothetical protein